MSGKNSLKRVQFDFREDAVSDLDTLVERTRATSRAEVVRRALDVYRNLLDAAEAGEPVIFRGQHLLLAEVRNLSRKGR